MSKPRYCIAIDPGSTESALVIWDGCRAFEALLAPNELILGRLKNNHPMWTPLVIEKIASYGMPVGAEVFETVYWSGRFAEAFGADRTHRITRVEVKTHLCRSARAKDANVRQALIDRLGPPGTKKSPGVMYGITSHKIAALAVAVTFWDQQRMIDSEVSRRLAEVRA